MPEQPKITKQNSLNLIETFIKGAAILAIPMYLGSHIGTALAPEGMETAGSLIGTYTLPFLAFVGLLGKALWNRKHQ